MRRLWETIGGIALAIVAVSCSNDSASHGCESPCEEPDAQACYTFGSGENSLVARAKCELDEKAGCFQWNFVEACNETCENDVCDPESKPEPPSPKPPSCTDGKYACFGKTLKQCKKMQPERRLGIRSGRVLAIAKPRLASVLKSCHLVHLPAA